MGSYLGFVYNYSSNVSIEEEIKSIVDALTTNNGKIVSYKFCEDQNGDSWRENRVDSNFLFEKIISSLINNYYGELYIICDFLNEKNLPITITINKINKMSFGILLDLEESKLSNYNESKNINEITEMVISFIIQVSKLSLFDYAFCDNEAKVEYSPLDFEKLDEEIYSIVAFKNDNDLKIVKNSWNIDGLTSRGT